MNNNYGTGSKQEPNKWLWCESNNNQVVIGIDELHNPSACNRITLNLKNKEDRNNLEKMICELDLALGHRKEEKL